MTKIHDETFFEIGRIVEALCCALETEMLETNDIDKKRGLEEEREELKNFEDELIDIKEKWYELKNRYNLK